MSHCGKQERLIGKGKRSGAWQYDKFMSSKKQPNLRKTYQEGNVDGYIRGHLSCFPHIFGPLTRTGPTVA